MSGNTILCHKCKGYYSVSGHYDHEWHCIGDEPEKSLKDASAWIERVAQCPIKEAQDALLNLKPELQRSKLDEWKACYAALFNTLNPVVTENKRLKDQLALDEREVDEAMITEAWDYFEYGSDHSRDAYLQSLQLIKWGE